MTKIKTFVTSDSEHCSDNDVNEFMKDKNVVDVKIVSGYWEKIVMVIYKENEDD